MRNGHFDDFAMNSHAPTLDLRVNLPFSTEQLHGVDLTHVIHSTEVAAAKGGNGGGHGGGGGGSGGGGTTFSPYTSGPTDPHAGFNITIQFSGTWTQELHDVFVAAADRLSDLIIGEIPDVSVRSRGQVTSVDDIVISAELGQMSAR